MSDSQAQSETGKSTVSLAPDLSALAVLEQTLEEFIERRGLDTALQFRLNLMLDELITNSVKYSLDKLPEPHLELQLSVEDGFVVARLEDNGPAFDPFTEAPQADTTSELADRPIGGLGIYLTKELSDHYAYQRINQRNCIVIHCRY